MRNNQPAVLPRWRDSLTLIVLVALGFCNSPASAACKPHHGGGVAARLGAERIGPVPGPAGAIVAPTRVQLNVDGRDPFEIAGAVIALGDRHGAGTARSPSPHRRFPATVLATYYASPAGSGTVCSVLQPCSLAAAQSLVRAATPSMTGDLVVRLMSGTYRLTSTFTLDASARDTGTSGFRVVYE